MTIVIKQPKLLYFYVFLLITGILASVYIKKVESNNDRIPIMVYDVSNQPPTENSVVVVWTTNALANSKVTFGIDESTYTKTVDVELTLDHLITITGLLPETTYTYCVYSEDAAKNIAESCGHSFTTTSGVMQDETPPHISNIQTTHINATWAKITWETNEVASSMVEYGETAEYGNTANGDDALSINHEVILTNLTQNTTYHFRARSTDGSGNSTTSGDMEFTTTNLPNIQEPPSLPNATGGHRKNIQEDILATPLFEKALANQITEIVTKKIGTSSAEMTFTTSKIATAYIEYGFTPTYGESTTTTHTAATEHSIILTNLQQNTEYNFRIVAIDEKNEKIFSNNNTFTTLKSTEDSTSPELIHDLSVSDINETSIELSWSAPFDSTGIRFYDINHSHEPINESNFYSEPTFHEKTIKVEELEQHGKMNSYRIVGLTGGQLSYFAIKASDSFGNISPISNVVSVTLPGGKFIKENTDTTPPAMVSEVQAIGFDRVITIWWRNPDDPDFTRTQVVRNKDHYPTHPSDGDIIYTGHGDVLSDSPLKNNSTYYYAIFTHDDVPNYSLPVKMSIAPSKKDQDYTVSDIGTVNHIALSLLITKDLKRGDTDHEVKHLQSILATDPSVYTDGFVTGYFGPLTEHAVLLLQEKYNLPTTGIVDTATREIINKLPLTSFLAMEMGNEMLTVFAHDILYGTQGDSVRALQSHLVKHGLLNNQQITGIYGPITREAVIKLQQEQGTPTDGIVGPITRSKIIDHVYQIMEKEGLLSPR